MAGHSVQTKMNGEQNVMSQFVQFVDYLVEAEKKKKKLSVVQGNKLCLMSPAQVMTGRREQVFVSDC